jgi:glycosyltransferase involved in cell wall biosynthesis
MSLSKDLTIVIPCKNEGLIIKRTLELINLQSNIKGVNVMVADSSTDDGFTQKCILTSFHNNINVKIVKGGFPAEARNNGTKKIKTPYVLFLDADIFIKEFSLLKNMVEQMKKNDYYKPHVDNGIFSLIFFLWDNTSNFEGGNLFFPEYNHLHECKNNHGILFFSRELHGVTPIIVNEEKSTRYSIVTFSNIKEENNVSKKRNIINSNSISYQ